MQNANIIDTVANVVERQFPVIIGYYNYYGYCVVPWQGVLSFVGSLNFLIVHFATILAT